LGHTPVYVKKGKRRKENYDLENDSPREFLVPHLENKINLKYVRNRSSKSQHKQELRYYTVLRLLYQLRAAVFRLIKQRHASSGHQDSVWKVIQPHQD
jgi:hypothetical protein